MARIGVELLGLDPLATHGTLDFADASLGAQLAGRLVDALQLHVPIDVRREDQRLVGAIIAFLLGVAILHAHHLALVVHRVVGVNGQAGTMSNGSPNR